MGGACFRCCPGSGGIVGGRNVVPGNGLRFNILPTGRLPAGRGGCLVGPGRGGPGRGGPGLRPLTDGLSGLVGQLLLAHAKLPNPI